MYAIPNLPLLPLLSLADPAVIAREFRDVAASARFLLPVVSVIRSRARKPPYVIRDRRIRETEAHPSRQNGENMCVCVCTRSLRKVNLLRARCVKFF